MGNRAIITLKDSKIGIYLHWNGGLASIKGFLQAAEHLGIMPKGDYFYARLVQIIGNFLNYNLKDGGSHSLGIDVLSELDYSPDNGFYVIENFKVIERFATLEDLTNQAHANIDNEEIDEEKAQKIYEKCLEANKLFF